MKSSLAESLLKRVDPVRLQAEPTVDLQRSSWLLISEAKTIASRVLATASGSPAKGEAEAVEKQVIFTSLVRLD